MGATMTAGPGITAIGQIAITVQDVERATLFYRDVLGLRFLFAAEPRLAFFDCGGVRLMLAVPESGERGHAGTVIYYRVTDLQASCAELRTRGATFESDPHLVARMPDHELWMAFLRDPDRNLVGVMSEMR
ncbi:MAG: glyoxalase [Gemmatimonadaceae bacterium]